LSPPGIVVQLDKTPGALARVNELTALLTLGATALMNAPPPLYVVGSMVTVIAKVCVVAVLSMGFPL
jgi:hypothetical protein